MQLNLDFAAPVKVKTSKTEARKNKWAKKRHRNNKNKRPAEKASAKGDAEASKHAPQLKHPKQDQTDAPARAQPTKPQKSARDPDIEISSRIDEQSSKTVSHDQEPSGFAIKKGMRMFAQRRGEWAEGVIKFASKKTEGGWAFEFDSDGKTLTRDATSLKPLEPVQQASAPSEDESVVAEDRPVSTTPPHSTEEIPAAQTKQPILPKSEAATAAKAFGTRKNPAANPNTENFHRHKAGTTDPKNARVVPLSSERSDYIFSKSETFDEFALDSKICKTLTTPKADGGMGFSRPTKVSQSYRSNTHTPLHTFRCNQTHVK